MYQVIVQRMVSHYSIPNSVKLKRWAKAVLQEKISNAEVTIRIVDEEEITMLNSTYRKKNKPTNVLSFPFEMPTDIEMDVPILGDIVICAEIIFKEAEEQNKSLDAHWAHMVTHGILHLLGYDHENEADADIMEAEEITILKKWGFKNPYQIVEKGEKQ